MIMVFHHYMPPVVFIVSSPVVCNIYCDIVFRNSDCLKVSAEVGVISSTARMLSDCLQFAILQKVAKGPSCKQCQNTELPKQRRPWVLTQNNPMQTHKAHAENSTVKRHGCQFLKNVVSFSLNQEVKNLFFQPTTTHIVIESHVDKFFVTCVMCS